MIAVPFVYFSILSLVFYRRHKCIDVATIISLIYAVSGFFGIIMKRMNLIMQIPSDYEITLIPAALYCILITLCILPISGCNVLDRVQLKPIRNIKMLKLFVVFAGIWFVAKTYLSIDDVMRVINGDMAQIRNEIYHGSSSEIWLARLSGITKLTFVAFNCLFGCGWTLVFLGFYSMLSPNLSLKWSIALIIISLSGLLDGIIGADRSKMAYWMIYTGTLYFLFRKHLPAKAKKCIVIIASIILVGVISYLTAMTVSRFGERSYGSQGGLIWYFGQSFYNYCYFFENYRLPHEEWGILFPAIAHFVFGLKSGGVLIQHEMTLLTGMHTGVFYTFMGQFIIALGQEWSVVITLLIALISTILLSGIKRRKSISVSTMYLYFAMASPILLGLFVHYYTSSNLTLSVVAMYFIIKLLNANIKLA